MKRNFYTLPARGSAALVVSATQPSRRVEVQEDGSATSQGVELFFAQDSYAHGYTYPAGSEPVVLGQHLAHAKGRGTWVGLPAQVVSAENPVGSGTVVSKTLVAATVLFKGTSATSTPTVVIVTEYD